MARNLDFSGKSVFVAGGTSGINLGVAEGFARHGAKVAVLSRSQDKVDAAVEKLKGYGQEAAGFAADVRDAEGVANALADAAAALGKFDVLISGAAGNFPAPALGISSNGFKAVMDIDVLGSFHVLRFAHPHLNAPGASIINISAPQSYVPMEMQAHVCAAKAGVDQLTRVLAIEWGRDGIRVNSIVPGPIEGTEGMARLAPTPEAMQRAGEAVPIGRLGTTDDIANAALFLSSPLASYVSGIVMPVDGGWSLSGAGLNTRALAQALREKPAG
jgi:NAD(P)-dependent dehydrogenase (short-subunit alcohol dehydrogenase family)